jgi:2'-5' RNA ligase
MISVRATDRLFFALIPDETTVEAICEARRKLCKATGVAGTEVLPQDLHVTLWPMGDSIVAPTDDDIRAIVRRASIVDMPPVRVSFRSAKSLSGGAFVLHGGSTAADLETLSARLRDALSEPGAEEKRPFQPHMTLLRSPTIVPPRNVRPITWTAREIVLVHGRLGQATQRPVGRLPLRPGPQLWLPGFDP